MSEAIVAWRAWGIIKPHFLQSPEDVWLPMVALEASCLLGVIGPGPMPDHIVSPQWGCSCGIYSLKTPQGLADYFCIVAGKCNMPVIGQVKLWGKIVEHEHGYRSQFAYPSILYILKEEFKPLAPLMSDLYGVPVEVGLPDNFPSATEVPRDYHRRSLPKVDPSPGNLQFSVLRSELGSLVAIAEENGHLLGQLATVLLENLDGDLSVSSKDLFDALVVAKLDGRVRTKVHPWEAFFDRKGAYHLMSRWNSI